MKTDDKIIIATVSWWFGYCVLLHRTTELLLLEGMPGNKIYMFLQHRESSKLCNIGTLDLCRYMFMWPYKEYIIMQNDTTGLCHNYMYVCIIYMYI